MDQIDVLNFMFLGISIGTLSKAALIVIMFSMGLTLEASQFKLLARSPKPVLVGLVGQMVLLPAVGLAFALAFDLPNTIAIGLIIIAACPGGATSNFMAYLAKGDVALSIVLTAISGLLAVFTVPLIVNISLSHFDLSEQVVSLPLVSTAWNIAILTVLPVAVGMTVRKMSLTATSFVEKILTPLSFLMLIIIMILVGVEVWPYLGMMLSLAFWPTAALNVTMTCLGLLLGAIAGLSRRWRITVAIEIGFQNYTLAIVIAIVMLENMMMTIVPIIYLFVMYLTAIFIVLWGRKEISETAVQSINVR